MRAEILEAQVCFTDQPLSAPLVLSTGTITELTEARAKVIVAVNGKRATGYGSIYLSDQWAWPDPLRTHSDRDAVLRELCQDIACHLREYCGGQAAHPLELGLRLHHNVCRDTMPPVLARAMCSSPFDAAIHDGVGIALGVSAFNLYDDVTPLPSADGYFADHRANAAIRRLLRQPQNEFPSWLIVGKNDSLKSDVAPWIRERGYRCFKLKVMGTDNTTDVARTIEVFHAARQFGATNPWLSVDSNEANPDAMSVLDYLKRLRLNDAAAFSALQYLEQPTARDILQHPQDWTEVALLKPILLDEGLTDLDLMKEATDQGWSGFALKTCKGHSFALVAAAWAHEQGLLLSLQDLTNPGLALIHAALFAAHVPTMNGVELNSPQFTPAANCEWLPRLAELFEPRRGVHCIPSSVVGLGSTL